ncbi:MAG: hypothetical protein JWM92_525 [Candidatus Nomurabacteria bacterium]|nr:hypothetical protein [Candidatus Nomurabacteria bacterium]
MVKFNEVTWYSKLAAIIFFIGVIPVLAFYIGTQYQQSKDALANDAIIPVYPKLTPHARAIDGTKVETTMYIPKN